MTLWESDEVVIALVGRAVGALKSKVELEEERGREREEEQTRVRSVSDVVDFASESSWISSPPVEEGEWILT